jgi:dihydropteroate synthase
MGTKSKEIPANVYSANGKLLTFTEPLIMAIVNLTPDSFYDGGKYSAEADVLRDTEDKINAGAHIIDLGAASSRPGARGHSAAEEWERLGEILKSIRTRFPGIFISVDTYHSEVARRAASEGADIINDISGGRLDAEMFNTVAALDLPYIMMHMDGTPETMSKNAPYIDVVEKVRSSLAERCARLNILGFDKIILDPGFGFGKSLSNNYELLKGLPELCGLGYPLLAGISRKSFIGKVTGSNPVTSLNGTTALNTIALLNGASILRVHDVAEAKQVSELVQFYKKAK